MKVLAGDIGGTKSLLAVVEVDRSSSCVLYEGRFDSSRYDGLGPIVHEFCARADADPERACFGVPGPVVEEECRTSNLPWTINARRLAQEIGSARTRLINDFETIGYGLDQLDRGDLATLQEGRPAPQGPRALLGAGTGLGEAFLLREGDGYRVHASEGGHADFAPRDALEWGLFEFLHGQYEHVSYERVLSGAGLLNIYRYLVERCLAPSVPEVQAEMAHEDPAAVISRHALAGTDAACTKALDIFTSVYGAEAGNLALKVLASGGVYLAGGIAPRILDKLQSGTFVLAFRGKGRLSAMLTNIPVHVILSPRVGLLGAAAVAARLE
jgi:glucokinase